jgi:hypothetical protein
MGRVIGISVDADVTEEMIQRQVANTLHVNLDGYWVATVLEGGGRLGALLSHSTAALNPATAEDIRKVVQARTLAEADPKTKKKKDGRPLKPGSSSTNWLAIQGARQEFVDWDQFADQLDRNKIVHIATDGGAQPNPGSGGWGVLMRQSGKYTQNWGHWDMASNNAMEILAVTEALANIPDQMHVWIMTDSAHVKNGALSGLATGCEMGGRIQVELELRTSLSGSG